MHVLKIHNFTCTVPSINIPRGAPLYALGILYLVDAKGARWPNRHQQYLRQYRGQLQSGIRHFKCRYLENSALEIVQTWCVCVSGPIYACTTWKVLISSIQMEFGPVYGRNILKSETNFRVTFVLLSLIAPPRSQTSTPRGLQWQNKTKKGVKNGGTVFV